MLPAGAQNRQNLSDA